MPASTSLSRAAALILIVFCVAPPAWTQAVLFQRLNYGPAYGASGSAIAAADMNADGWQDLVIGEPEANSGSGRVVVISGWDRSTLFTFTGTYRFGSAVAAGDVNADGFSDVIMASDGTGNPAGAVGAVEVRSGFNGSLLFTSAWNLRPGGISVAAVGDIDGDGLGDFAIDDTVRSLAPGGINITAPGAAAWTRWRCRASRLGDYDADGFGDLALAYLDTPNPGAPILVQALRGPTLIPGASWTFTLSAGYAAGDAGVAGDTDGDGAIELFVGVTAFPSAFGEIRFFELSAALPVTTLFAPGPDWGFGSAVVPVGDLDGDGRQDLACGGAALNHPYGATGQGILFISPATAAVLGEVSTFHWAAGFNGRLVATGDLSGDGVTDVMAGLDGVLAFPGVPPTFLDGVVVASPVNIPGASRTDLGGGCAAGGAPPVLDLTTDPRLGTQNAVVVYGAPPGASGVFGYAAAPPLATPLGGGCTLHLDPAQNWSLLPFVTDATGSWAAGFTVPVTPNWSGYTLSAQAALFPSAAALGFDLSNGLRAVFGF